MKDLARPAFDGTHGQDGSRGIPRRAGRRMRCNRWRHCRCIRRARPAMKRVLRGLRPIGAPWQRFRVSHGPASTACARARAVLLGPTRRSSLTWCARSSAPAGDRCPGTRRSTRPLLIGTTPNIGAAAPRARARCWSCSRARGTISRREAAAHFIEDQKTRTASHLGMVKTGGNYAAALGPTLEARKEFAVDRALLPRRVGAGDRRRELPAARRACSRAASTVHSCTA